MSNLSGTIVSLPHIRPLCRHDLNIIALTSCSIECFRQHQSAHPNPPHHLATPLVNGLPPKPPTVLPNQSTLQSSTLGHPTSRGPVGLTTPEELEQLFRLHPQLRELLDTIYKSTLDLTPKDKFNQQHNWGHYGHAATRGRFGGRRTYKEPPWTQQRGFQNGLYTLRKVTLGDTRNSEALQAFTELVTRAKHDAAAG